MMSIEESKGSESFLQDRNNKEEINGGYKLLEKDKETIKVNLKLLAVKGLKALQDSVPKVLTKEFLEKDCFYLNAIPYLALIMKGIEEFIKEQSVNLDVETQLNSCLSSVDSAICKYTKKGVDFHFTFCGEELAREFDLKGEAPIGDLSYSASPDHVYYFTRVAAFILRKKIEECPSFEKPCNLKFMQRIYDLSMHAKLIELDCTIEPESYLVKVSKEQEIINNKKIVAKLHKSFKKRIKFFSNEKDKEKNRRFKAILEKDDLTTEDIEDVVTFHTGRFGGLFGCFSGLFGSQPTSQTEYEQMTGKTISVQ